VDQTLHPLYRLALVLIFLTFMANRRRRIQRRQGQRRPPIQRNTMRALSRAVLFKPVRSKVPVDPPPVIRTISGSTILPILLTVGTSENGCQISAGSVDSYTKLALPINGNKILSSCGITGSDLSQCLFAWQQWANGTTFSLEFAIRKVSLWGPNPIAIPGAVYRNTEIGLSVDLGDISGTLQLNDAGTSIRRPCVGISVPFTIWMAKSDDILITVYPDVTYSTCPLSTGDVWGRLHISLDWRRGPGDLPGERTGRAAQGAASSTQATTAASTPPLGRRR